MPVYVRVGLLAGLFAATAVAVAYARRPAAPPAAAFPEALDLGERPFGSEAIGRFQIGNRGGTELVVGEFATSCSCAGVEIDGERSRLGSLRLAPGKSVDLAVRVAVGAKVGTPQTVHIAFTTNDPQRPSGVIVATIPRVQGGCHAEPVVAVFGEVTAGERPTQTVRLFDNNIPGSRVAEVRSLNPTRFAATLVRLPAGEPAARHESAGHHIASVVITPRADAGPLNGQVEIRLAGDGRTPDRIDIIGEVVGPVTCRPDGLVLPRYVGGKPVFEGSVVVTGRDGRPVRVAVASAPAGVTVTADPAEGGEVGMTVRAASGAAGGPVRLRVRPAGGDETTVEIPVSVATGK